LRPPFRLDIPEISKVTEGGCCKRLVSVTPFRRRAFVLESERFPLTDKLPLTELFRIVVVCSRLVRVTPFRSKLSAVGRVSTPLTSRFIPTVSEPSRYDVRTIGGFKRCVSGTPLRIILSVLSAYRNPVGSIKNVLIDRPPFSVAKPALSRVPFVLRFPNASTERLVLIITLLLESTIKVPLLTFIPAVRFGL